MLLRTIITAGKDKCNTTFAANLKCLKAKVKNRDFAKDGLGRSVCGFHHRDKESLDENPPSPLTHQYYNIDLLWEVMTCGSLGYH